MAKNGWKLSKVAITGSTRSLLAKNSGCWQSDTANNTLCRYCFQVHPFLAKKAPGAPVFGHCPFFNRQADSYGNEKLIRKWTKSVFLFGTKNIGLSSGVSPRCFYCGKTTVISVQAVTVIKHNYRYRATRYRENTHLPIRCKTLPSNS